jgi:hypothetical protein
MDKDFREYIIELDLAIEALQRHRIVYAAHQIALPSWHSVCQKTWEDAERRMADLILANRGPQPEYPQEDTIPKAPS